MTRIISTSLSPNTEKDDVFAAFFLLFQPWRLKKGDSIERLELYFKTHFGFENCFSFNSGRSCLLAIFDAIDLKEGDEVIVQSYTCNAVINPILKRKALPVYIDIKSDLNIDSQKIEAKITPKTKAIIAQHTFGMPSDLDTIKEICRRRNILLIEDCAHSLGAKYDNKYCGSFGDFSFFSFGRDKVISSVYGGMLIINNKDYLPKIEKFREGIDFPTKGWTFQQLLHPVITSIFVYPFYGSKFGKGILAYSLNFHILSKAVTEEENNGILPEYFPKKMPNALAYLALKQIKKLEKFNLWRKGVVDFYKFELEEFDNLFAFNSIEEKKDPIYMRFPLIIKNSVELIESLKKQNIYLNDGWRESVIVPSKTNKKIMKYVEESCPVAEVLCEKIVSLPTHIRLRNHDLKKIVTIVKEHLKRN
ncbi:MAG: aminotransferase class V-fold PLP-dependent enzyme [Candidatus Paceibacterota bacterium]|jgi:dTDP-4-amino-4,6-dideoxygalactose transaminase|nr:aminotransferase class V-fold PLP-dependent enzyme [bacterium]